MPLEQVHRAFSNNVTPGAQPSESLSPLDDCTPENGPGLMFFSGGSALRDISQHLPSITRNSVHMVTPFDGGGSSQLLRDALDIPAVGDLRSRLVTLAEPGPAADFMAHRLPKTDASGAEIAQLRRLSHPLLRAIPGPTRQILATDLDTALRHLPPAFDFSNASIGNLVIAGGWLAQGGPLTTVLARLSRVLQVRGTLRAVSDANLHIGAELRDGRVLHSQRLLTGKEVAPLDSPITRLFLSDGTSELPASAAPLGAVNQNLIAKAELICFAPGSLYTSLVASLLPSGTGRAIAASAVPKVYLPALGHDPEALGHTLADRVDALLSPLRQDAGPLPATAFLSHVICDQRQPLDDCDEVSRRHQIPCLRLQLADPTSTRYDPARITALLSRMAAPSSCPTAPHLR
ncbi:GAK system CofD-like protein [Sagittula marina]|nr:GAK system CofD-like protein [Sagittula marina]